MRVDALDTPIILLPTTNDMSVGVASFLRRVLSRRPVHDRNIDVVCARLGHWELAANGRRSLSTGALSVSR